MYMCLIRQNKKSVIALTNGVVPEVFLNILAITYLNKARTYFYTSLIFL